MQDVDFDNCVLLGPAVLLAQACTFDSTNFGAELDAMLWMVSDDRKEVTGAILVLGCTFTRCRFDGVGFAANDEFAAEFRKGVGQS